MIQYIQVAEDEGEEPMEVPSEDDGTLLLSTLSAQFPGACGLKYRNPDSGSMRGIRLSDGRLYPPDGSWVNRLYIAVFPKSSDTKKLREESGDMGAVKKKSEKSKCSDLIVLGLPWKSTEEDLRKYFSQIGELLMVQVKKDPKTGMSKGFGFIRFADYDAQTKCMGTRHVIDGRWCDVRIPNSKVQVEENQQNVMNRKVFVGRCTEDMTAEDLRSYFNKYGEVVDVFIPKPFRAFAFVTFSDAETAQCLCGEDHIIKGASVHISSAAPKSFDRQNDKKVMMPGHHMYSQYAAHRPWNQAGQNVGQGLGSQGTGNMPSNMGLNNLSLGAIQFTPAIMAAAQAMLSGQGGWGPVGLVSQGNSAPNVPVSGNTTPGPMNPSSAPPTGGGGDAQNQASGQSFGSIGSVSQGPPTTPIPPPTNSFLGWGGGSQGAEQGNSSAGWGTPQSKTGGTWN